MNKTQARALGVRVGEVSQTLARLSGSDRRKRERAAAAMLANGYVFDDDGTFAIVSGEIRPTNREFHQISEILDPFWSA